eukprot:m.350888 g.350888  ORF g.350888 m.350888 type:complete len:335 (-) comp20694_c0_seq7:122-1126(-)
MSPTTTYAKVSAAAFYAISSILIMAVNKYTLTVYRFPSSSFLAFAQMIVTIILLRAAKAAGLVTFPHFSLATCKKVFPLPLIYLGNIVTGLTGTKMLSLPMFSVLRRFSILMTMIGEIYLLGNKYTDKVKLSVFLMLFGAIVAASDDLAFNFMGYCWVFASNFFTAANGVILKQKLDSKELGSFGLMFYNCIVSLPVILVVLYMEDAYKKVANYKHLNDTTFQLYFATSSVMGCVLTYSVFLCTQVNSALTTTVVGCLKNVTISYAGMFIGGDYVFSLTNFAGLNISILGSFYYSYLQLLRKSANIPDAPTAVVVHRSASKVELAHEHKREGIN